MYLTQLLLCYGTFNLPSHCVISLAAEILHIYLGDHLVTLSSAILWTLLYHLFKFHHLFFSFTENNFLFQGSSGLRVLQ